MAQMQIEFHLTILNFTQNSLAKYADPHKHTALTHTHTHSNTEKHTPIFAHKGPASTNYLINLASFASVALT